MFRLYQYGFTLIELMIVVGILAILASVAIVSYSGMRQKTKKTVCIANLRQIDGAIEQWSIMNDVDEGIELTPSGLPSGSQTVEILSWSR